MIGQAIGIVGLVLRLVGYLLGGMWVLLGLLKVAGVDNDERIDGPQFIGMGVVLLAVVFAFSMRKRRAKKRASASKQDNSFPEMVRDDLSGLRDKLMSDFEKVLDEQNIMDPAERAAFLQAEWDRIQAATEKAVLERLTKRT